VTPFVGDVVVVVGVVVVVVEVLVGKVVVDGKVVVIGKVVVVTKLKVVVVVESGEAALPAASHAFGVPKMTGAVPTGAATRTLPEPSMLMSKYVHDGND
jgi:hypothetical protein